MKVRFYMILTTVQNLFCIIAYYVKFYHYCIDDYKNGVFFVNANDFHGELLEKLILMMWQKKDPRRYHHGQR